jgi:hypothetical protein
LPHTSNETDDIAKILIEAARQSAPKLANERGITLDNNSMQIIEKGLINALYHSESEYNEDPEIRTIIERSRTTDAFNSHVTEATKEVISSILDCAKTNRVTIRPEDVERVILELFSIWPFKRKKPPERSSDLATSSN